MNFGDNINKKRNERDEQKTFLLGKNIGLNQDTLKDNVKRKINKTPKLNKKLLKNTKNESTNSRTKMKRLLKRPVGYTWNKGGRLKELRIRNQARKFLYIWKAKTFGKLTFSDAKKYYKSTLTQKCFNAWKSDWWHNNVEWKLSVRAEYHYKYQLYVKVLKSWLIYHQQNQEKKKLECLAHANWKKNILQKILSSWKTFTIAQRVKNINNGKAEDFCKNRIVKGCFGKWVQEYYAKTEEKRCNEIASWHWMMTIQKQVWHQWKEMYTLRKERQILYQYAENHHRLFLIKSKFTVWLKYVIYRRQKMAVKNYAFRRREIYLMFNAIKLWRGRLQRLQQIRDQEQNIIVLANRFTCRRMVIAWVYFKNECLRQKANEIVATKFYATKILSKCLSGLKIAVSRRKQHITMKYYAVEYNSIHLMQVYFNKWTDAYDRKCEVKMFPNTKFAEDHFNKLLLQKCFNFWKKWLEGNKREKEKVLKAESHFILKALPKHFTKWKEYIETRKLKNASSKKAQDFARCTSLAKTFYHWWGKYDGVHEFRTMERMAILHNNQNILQYHFRTWKLQYAIKQKALDDQRVAVSLHCRILLLRSFDAWKKYVHNQYSKRQNVIKAATHAYHTSILQHWSAWRTYTLNVKAKRGKNKLALDHYATRQLQKTFNLWKDFHRKEIQGKNIADERFNLKRLQSLKRCMNAWKDFTKTSKFKQGQCLMAYNHHRNTVLKSSITKWKLWVSFQLHHQAQMEEKFNSCLLEKNRNTLLACFRHWKSNAVNRKHSRLKETLAVNQYNKKLCHTAFQIWTLFRYTKTKKAILIEQAINFNCVNMKKRFFQQWRINLVLKKEENLQTAKALWSWALNLEYKVFNNWYTYVQNRKRKSIRYKEAMLHRRNRLVKNGCLKIIEMNSDQVAMHTKTAACQQAKTSYKAYHLAWKFAKRWRSVVEERRNHIDQYISIPNTQLGVWIQKNVKIVNANICNEQSSWIPEPTIQAKSPKRSTMPSASSSQPNRPLPRKPEFLMESLQSIDVEIDSCEKNIKKPLVEEHTKKTNNTIPQSSSNKRSDNCHNNHQVKIPIIEKENKQTTETILLPPSAFGFTENEMCSGDHAIPEPQNTSFVNIIKTNLTQYSSFSSTDTSTYSSYTEDYNLSFQSELQMINNEMQKFRKLKAVLSNMKKQKKSLEKCLVENQFTPGSNIAIQLQGEIKEVEVEITEMQLQIMAERPQIQNLALRLQELLNHQDLK